jgi:hypothetical protein
MADARLIYSGEKESPSIACAGAPSAKPRLRTVRGSGAGLRRCPVAARFATASRIRHCAYALLFAVVLEN